jgi:hypothetical protein
MSLFSNTTSSDDDADSATSKTHNSAIEATVLSQVTKFKLYLHIWKKTFTILQYILMRFKSYHRFHLKILV